MWGYKKLKKLFSQLRELYGIIILGKKERVIYMVDIVLSDNSDFVLTSCKTLEKAHDRLKEMKKTDKYLQEYYDKMIQIDIDKALWQTQLLEHEIKQMQNKRGVK